jgi:hypothetical protein
MDKVSPHFVQDKTTGIFVPLPEKSGTYVQHPFNSPNTENPIRRGVVAHGEDGTRLRFDDDTGIAFWPPYASGIDDLLMRAITRGHMANGGMTPVLLPMLSTIVAKRQAMVGTWTTTVTGKRSPVKATLDLMALADGSSMGPIDFVQNIIGALDVDNRGAMIAQVPFHLIGWDDWDKYGMVAEPMKETGSRGRPRNSEKLFTLRMDQEDFREVRGVWTVDGLHCYPTGNPEYPFWIRKWRDGKQGDAWVLIHKDYGFQILQRSGPRSSHYAGFGQSGTWRFSPYAVKHMAISRMDWEMLIAQPPRGIVWASGLDTATQLRDQLTRYRDELTQEEILLYPSVFFGGTTGENSKIALIPWTEPPHGYTPPEWMDEVISNLASSFHMNETHLRLKLGEGAMTQSGVAEAIEAETSISWMRQQIENVWNHIAPPRITVTVVWQSDRTIRYQIESFREYSLAVSRLQKQSPGAEFQQEQVFTRDEIRAMLTQTIGLEIPDIEADEGTATARDDGKDISNGLRFSADGSRGGHLARLSSLPSGDWIPGRVVWRTERLEPAVITGYSGRGEWLWIMQDGREILTHARDCFAAPTQRGTVNFQVEGDPAAPPPDDDEELVINYNVLARQAEREMAEVGGFDMNDPNWDWDPVDRVWVNTLTEEVMDPQMMVVIRDRYADGTSDRYAPAEEEEDPSDPSWLWLLLLGSITLATWELEMRDNVARAMLAQWMFASGGDVPTGADRELFEANIRSEWAFLHGFAQRMADDGMSDGQIRANTRLYFSGTIGEYELARATGYTMELPAYPGDCSSECCANDRCFISYVYIPGDDEDGRERIEAAWNRTAAESCPTCLKRDACPPIIFYPQTGEYENWDCWIS